MALITSLQAGLRNDFKPHAEVEAAYQIVNDPELGPVLQIDTFSGTPRHKTQTVRFSPKAMGHLKTIIAEFGL